ncbi:MAG: DUF899 family protein [Polyangiaceae bacterium]
MSTIHFPGENKAYREARDDLLKAEIDLKAQTEKVAALRRKLPIGGEVTIDYVFDEGASDVADTKTVKQTHLVDLFGDKDTLVLYSFMYGPNMKAPCPMCTSFLDALDGQAEALGQTVALAISAKSPIARVRDFARERGWSHLRLLSAASSTYTKDYFGEDDEGHQMPMMNVFAKRDGKAHHFWGSEMLYADARTKDADSRHIDMLWPLWNVLDLTPGGRGTSWYPKLRYE